jgi:hypothetical protein
MEMLQITEITNPNQFYELKYKWNEILEKSKDKNPYLTWEYTSTFWKHFGQDKKLKILCLADKAGIIAIAPLRQSRYSYAGLLRYTVIEPLAYRGLGPEGADYTGIMLTKQEPICLKLFLDYIIKQNSWDFIYLMDIPETSTTANLLLDAFKTPLQFEVKEGEQCPFLLVPDSIDSLLKGLNAKFRKNLRRSMRSLQKDFGQVEFKKYDEIGSVEETMRIFFKLHQKRCASKGLPGVFADQEICNFYIDVARLFAENEWLALYFLTIKGEPIAAQYSFEYAHKMYYALGGFDPYYSKYSVGNLMCLKMIEKCIERKLEEYDLLKGDETYKFNWTSKYRTNMMIRFVNKKFTSIFYDWGIKALKKTGASSILQALSSYS